MRAVLIKELNVLVHLYQHVTLCLLRQGAHYWQFDESRLTVSPARGSIRSKWPGAPQNIDAAVRLNDGYLYLFKGSRCAAGGDGRGGSHPWQRDVSPDIQHDMCTEMRFYLNCRYHKYNEAARRVESGYPKTKAGSWMGPTCTDDGSYQWK